MVSRRSLWLAGSLGTLTVLGAGVLFSRALHQPPSTRLVDAAASPLHDGGPTSADLSDAATLEAEVSPLDPLHAATGDAVVVSLPDRVVLLSEQGGPPITIGRQRASFCLVDRTGDVLWYTQAEPGTAVDGGLPLQSLYAQDLRHPGKHWLIASGLPSVSLNPGMNQCALKLSYGEQHVGERSLPGTGSYGVELQIEVSDKPTLKGEMLGCDDGSGENIFFCRDHGVSEDGKQEEDIHKWPLLPVFNLTLEAIKRAKLVGPEALRQLALRHNVSADAAPPAEVPDLQPAADLPPFPETWPRIKPKDCEGMPSDSCGQMTRIEGTALVEINLGYTVPGGESDFAHSFSRLYDPKQKLFIDPCDPSHRAKNPLDKKVPLLSGKFEISRSGTLWLRSDQVCRPGREPLPLPPDSHVCGMLQPGTAKEFN